VDEKRLRKLAGLKNLNETLTTKDFRDLAVVFGSAPTDNLSVKVMTQVVKNFIKLAKAESSGFNEDRFINLLRRESPRLARSLKGEKEPEGEEDSETNESELNERLEAPSDVATDLTIRISKVTQELDELFFGPAADPSNEEFDKVGVKKVLALFKKIDNDLKKIEKNVEAVNKMGLI